MIYIIGSSGLVGSAICEFFEKEGIEFRRINRLNYDEYAGTSADVVINANGSGLKGKANEDPRADFEKNVLSTMDHIFQFRCQLFIHISSIDVYPEPSVFQRTSEDEPIVFSRLQPYGFHKYLSEMVVRRYCTNWIILRLGGLVGKNLKKNAVYDWTHNKPLLISKKSRLNFIHTEIVAKIIHLLIGCKINREIINICASDSIELASLPLIGDFEIHEASPIIQNYNIDIKKLWNFFPVGTSAEYIRKYLTENLNQ